MKLDAASCPAEAWQAQDKGCCTGTGPTLSRFKPDPTCLELELGMEKEGSKKPCKRWTVHVRKIGIYGS